MLLFVDEVRLDEVRLDEVIIYPPVITSSSPHKRCRQTQHAAKYLMTQCPCAPRTVHGPSPKNQVKLPFKRKAGGKYFDTEKRNTPKERKPRNPGYPKVVS